MKAAKERLTPGGPSRVIDLRCMVSESLETLNGGCEFRHEGPTIFAVTGLRNMDVLNTGLPCGLIRVFDFS